MAAPGTTPALPPQVDQATRLRMLLDPQATLLEKRLADLQKQRQDAASQLAALDNLIADLQADVAAIRSLVPTH